MNGTPAAGGEVKVSWSAIYVTAFVTFAQGVIFYAFFLYQRKKSKDLFEPRQNTRSHRSPPPYEGVWWKQALKVSDTELLRCVGLDSYMFLRFVRMGARICALAVLLSLALIPVYATGTVTDAAAQQFNQLTLAHVSQKSLRIWAALGAWWVLVAGILYEFYREWKEFKVHRSDFMAVGDVDTAKEYRYAVQVEKVPQKYRTNQKLERYFDRLFPNQVHQATIVLQMDELQDLIQERQEHIEKMEKAVAFTHGKPDKPRPKIKVKKGMCGGEKVDEIDHHTDEIKRLNQEIDDMRAKYFDVDRNDDDAKMERGVASKTDSHSLAATKAASRVPYVSMPTDESISTEAMLARVRAGETSVPPGVTSDKDLDETEDEDANDDEDTKLGFPTGTAYVTFASLRSKQAAIQCELTGNPDKILVKPAPMPSGIMWENADVRPSRQSFFQMWAMSFWMVGILFWAVPVSFVIGLANLASLMQTVGLPSVNTGALWYGLIAGVLPPLFLTILMMVLYMTIVYVAKNVIRFKSMPEVDAYVFFWHQCFQFANLWLILIGGSLFSQLNTLINNPTEIVQTVAKALPSAAMFFSNNIIVSTFGAFGMELSMLMAYGTGLIMKLFQKEELKTQRELDTAKKPPSMEWGKAVPPVVFQLLVSIVYLPIAPLLPVFGLIYFAGLYVVMKHQFLHVYAQEFESGGDVTWIRLFPFLMACLYVGEVIFIAYMGIKKASTQGGLGFVPLAVTILVHHHLQRTIIGPLRCLALEKAADVDIDCGQLTKKEFDDKHYFMPSLDLEKEERGPMPYRRDDGGTTEEAEDEKWGDRDPSLQAVAI